MRDDGFSARAGGGEACDARADADDALLAEVGAVFREMDPVPSQVVEAACELLVWRGVDGGLVELLSGAASAAPPARPAAR
jgi:hypothetical protein